MSKMDSDESADLHTVGLVLAEVLQVRPPQCHGTLAALAALVPWAQRNRGLVSWWGDTHRGSTTAERHLSGHNCGYSRLVETGTAFGIGAVALVILCTMSTQRFVWLVEGIQNRCLCACIPVERCPGMHSVRSWSQFAWSVSLCAA